MVDVKVFLHDHSLPNHFHRRKVPIFAEVISGKYLFISIERIASCSETVTNDPDRLPTDHQLVFSLPEKCQVYSLAFHKDFLIVGLNGEICGYRWNGKNGTIGKKTWTVKLTASTEYTDINEVNYLWMDKDEGIL